MLGLRFMLQHFVSQVSSDTLTCCDICILMFHCDLANVADAESRCCRHVLLGVANLIFQCCRRCVSMLQTRGVGCCVEEKGEGATDVGCCTQHGSQHSRNIVATWSQHGEERRKTPDVGCCKQPCSQHFHITFATHSQHLPVVFRSNG
jgi:hypothetical protein